MNGNLLSRFFENLQRDIDYDVQHNVNEIQELYQPQTTPFLNMDTYGGTGPTCINIPPIYMQTYTNVPYLNTDVQTDTKETIDNSSETVVSAITDVCDVRKMNSDLLFEIRNYPYTRTIKLQKEMLAFMNFTQQSLSEDLAMSLQTNMTQRETIVDRDLDIDFLKQSGALLTKRSQKLTNKNSELSAENLSLRMSLVDLQLEYNSLLEKYNVQIKSAHKLSKIQRASEKKQSDLVKSNTIHKLEIRMLNDKVKSLELELIKTKKESNASKRAQNRKNKRLARENAQLVSSCTSLTKSYIDVQRFAEGVQRSMDEVVFLNRNLNNSVQELQNQNDYLNSSLNCLHADNNNWRTNYFSLEHYIHSLQYERDTYATICYGEQTKNKLLEDEINGLVDHSYDLFCSVINNSNDVTWLLDRVAELNRANVKLEGTVYILEQALAEQIADNILIDFDNLLLENVAKAFDRKLGLTENDVEWLLEKVSDLNNSNVKLTDKVYKLEQTMKDETNDSQYLLTNNALLNHNNIYYTNQLYNLEQALKAETESKTNYKNEFSTVNSLLTKRDIEIAELRKQMKLLQRENSTKHNNLLISESNLKALETKLQTLKTKSVVQSVDETTVENILEDVVNNFVETPVEDILVVTNTSVGNTVDVSPTNIDTIDQIPIKEQTEKMTEEEDWAIY